MISRDVSASFAQVPRKAKFPNEPTKLAYPRTNQEKHKRQLQRVVSFSPEHLLIDVNQWVTRVCRASFGRVVGRGLLMGPGAKSKTSSQLQAAGVLDAKRGAQGVSNLRVKPWPDHRFFLTFRLHAAHNYGSIASGKPFGVVK